MENTEIWKDIEGYEGLYQVSNLGRVKSLARKRGNQFDYKDIILQQHIVRNYFSVVLQKDGVAKCYRIHRLVAQEFKPNPDNLPCVNHKDENKLNNNIENLEWCTYKYNSNYGTAIERCRQKRLNHKKFSKVVKRYDLQGNYIDTWSSLREIERKLGFNHTRIAAVCNHRKYCKSAFGYKWEYAENNELNVA